MRSRSVPLILIALLAPAAAPGQTPPGLSSFGVELRGEVALPTSAFEERFDLEAGFGFGAAVKYSIARFLALYAGWDRFEFDGTPEALGVEVVDRGFRLGVQAGVPEPSGRLSPFATAGVIFNRTSLELRDTLGTTELEGERSAGYEWGGGLSIPVLRGVWLVPEGRFRSHSGSWETAVLEEADVRVTYFAFNLGVVVRLPRRVPAPAEPVVPAVPVPGSR